MGFLAILHSCFPGHTVPEQRSLTIVFILPCLLLANMGISITLAADDFTLGDMNCDGIVDNLDIDPFVLALHGEAGYSAQFPDCDWWRADCDGSGNVDSLDIDPFLSLLNNASDYTISGSVYDYDGEPYSGITVQFIGTGGSMGEDFTATTMGDGSYTQDIPGGWSGFVAAGDNYRLEPDSVEFHSVNMSYADVDFDAFRNFHVHYPSGDDDGSGTFNDPFRTIAEARLHARPGDIIYLSSGIHPVNGNMDFRPSRTFNGTESHPITVKAYPGETPVVEGSGGTSRIFQLREGLQWWRFEDFEMRGASTACFELSQTSNVVISNIVAHDCSAPFVVGGASHDVTLIGCEAYNFYSKGFHGRESATDITFIDCVAHDSINGGQDGWEVNNSCSRTTFQGCEAYDCADAGFDIASDTVVEDCIAHDCSAGFKLWDSRKQNPNGKHLFVYNLVYNCQNYGVLLAVRHSSSHGGGGGDNHADILNSTVVDCKINIWIGTSSDQGYSSTATIKNTIASHAMNQGGGGTIRALYVETDNNCRLLEERNNCWHRYDGTAVIRYRYTDYAYGEINDGTWTAATGFGQNSTSVDPQYCDFENLDCRLSAPSPCIDVGLDLGYDYLGEGPDLGAFESY